MTETDTSGFHIGGTNIDEVIAKMDSLNDNSIDQIEIDARPGNLSQAGFLGNGEQFKERLKADNDFVMGKGFTHQQLATPLLSVMNILDTIGDRRFDDSRIMASTMQHSIEVIVFFKNLFSTMACG